MKENSLSPCVLVMFVMCCMWNYIVMCCFVAPEGSRELRQ